MKVITSVTGPPAVVPFIVTVTGVEKFTFPPVTNNPPLTLSEPDIDVFVPTSNPLSGEITA